MLVRFYAFDKIKNSTKIPSNHSYIDREIKLKGEVQITSPELLLTPIPNDYNYCYIATWGRFYFIKEKSYVTNDLMRIILIEDFLGTYRSAIGNSTQFVERSSHSYNTMFNDNLVSSTQNIVNKSYSLSAVPGMTKSAGCYMVRIANGNYDGGVASYIVDELTDLAPIFDKETYREESQDWWTDALSFIINPMDYVLSVKWVPFTRSKLSEWGVCNSLETEIYVKSFRTYVNGYRVLKQYYTITSEAISMPSTYYSDFRKYTANFTQYKIYVPGIGLYDLSPQDVSLGEMTLVYTIDFLTGEACVKLKSGNDGQLIASYTGLLYGNVQISGANADVVGAIGSGLATVGSVMAGNVPGAAVGLVSTIVNSLVPTPSINGNVGGGVGVIYYNSIIIIQYAYGSGGLPIFNCGRPLMEYRQISSIPGFIKCGNAALSINAYEDEMDEIINYLNEGFYYE